MEFINKQVQSTFGLFIEFIIHLGFAKGDIYVFCIMYECEYLIAADKNLAQGKYVVSV